MADSPARVAVLGLLIERPSYPYDVAVRFERRVGPQWEIHRGQVYETVKRLERDGLVERVDKSGDDTSPAIYRATARGEEVFETWLTSDAGVKPNPVRDAFFVRLAFLRPHHAPGLLQSVVWRERTVLRRIQEYTATYPEIEEPAAGSEWAATGLHLIIEGSVASLQAELRWLRRVRDALESLSSGATPPR